MNWISDLTLNSHNHFEILLVLMVVVWGAGRIFKIFHLPPMLGEILSGVLLGPSVLGVLHSSEVILILAELGVFFLMFHSGLDTDLKKFVAQSKNSLLISIGGMVPIVLSAYALLRYWQVEVLPALFIAHLLALNSIPVIMSVMKTYSLKNTRIGNAVLGATVANEIILFVALSIIISVATLGTFSFQLALWVAIKVLLFFGIVLIVGRLILPYIAPVVLNRSGSKGFTFALIVALIFAIIAESIGLHFVIGAYLAGMFVREEINNPQLLHKIEDRFYGLSHSFLGPIFFASVGMSISFAVLGESPWIVLTLLSLIFVGQMLGSTLVAWYTKVFSAGEGLVISALLSGRGSTEIIMAQIGFSTIMVSTGERLVSETFFPILVILSFLSSLLMPFLVKGLVFLRKAEKII